MSNSAFPLVSIITPSYNQGYFIQETINSVLQQDYRQIEHIVVDGGSTDQTLTILQSNAQADERLHFVSEPDRGQSHAINKALAMAKGEIVGWLNSDDTYLPGAISKAVQAFQAHPEWGMLHGQCYIVNGNSQIMTPFYSEQATDFSKLANRVGICQPAAFLRKNVFDQVGGVDENLHFCMDYELWMRVAKQHIIGYIPEFIANARLHGGCKSATQWQSVGVPETLMTLAKHYGKIPDNWVSNECEGMAVFALLNKIKTVSPNQPRIVSMNRSMDLCAPPLFHVQIASESHAPAQMLVIKGSLPASPDQDQTPLNVTARINGQPYKTYSIHQVSFQLLIPLDPTKAKNQVDITASRIFSPQSLGMGSVDTIGFIAEEVIPLSREEEIVYRAFSKA